MTQASHSDTTAAWLACAECQAPLDATQRYCVSCGARHAGAESPAARYFATMAARRRPPAPRPPRRGVGIGVAALLAVLPLAVGGGVLIGRAGHGDANLLQALRGQKPTVVNVGGGTGGSDTASTDGNGAASGTDSGGGAGSNAVVATGIGGVAHSVLHHKSTAATRARDKQVVRHVSQTIGKSYIESQRDLPDVIDVQPDPGAGAAPPPGTDN